MSKFIKNQSVSTFTRESPRNRLRLMLIQYHLYIFFMEEDYQASKLCDYDISSLVISSSTPEILLSTNRRLLDFCLLPLMSEIGHFIVH